ncbi:MAG: ABC transporter permease [Bacteroidales bacterium]|jgi:ABC-2 type transport system permease protein|nr:ABC transporter permease [Bacteroidales bacterium]
MKRFMAFVKKEFLHIFRDYRTLIILFGIPAAQILIFGYAVRTDLKNANIAVLDNAHDEVSQALTLKLEASEFFTVSNRLSSYDEVNATFKKGKIKAVIIFPENMAEKLTREGNATVSIIADGSEPNTASLVTGYTTGILSDYSSSLTKELTAALPVINPEVRMFFNPNLKSHFMFVPGVITLILLLISALMTSVTIVREKEFGTMEVLLVSPLKPWQIIVGKVAPYFFLSLVNVIVILLMAWFVFDLPVRGSIALLIAECMLYILLGLAIGILVSASVDKMENAIFISFMALMLPTILLSGFIFPIENMPKVYDYVSMLLPPRWFIEIIRSIMIKGAGFGYVWKETLVLVVMAVFFMVLSARKFKVRLGEGGK